MPSSAGERSHAPGCANLPDDMTRDRLWTLLAILLPVLGATIAPMSTVDLAYQVRVGDLIRASGSVLTTDPLTFTAAGQAWLNQQWGASLLLSLGYSAGGWAGLALLRAILVGLAVALVFWTARRALPVRPSAALALTGFVVGIGALALRAQLFGLVCFVLVVALLAGRRERPRLALVVPARGPCLGQPPWQLLPGRRCCRARRCCRPSCAGGGPAAERGHAGTHRGGEHRHAVRAGGLGLRGGALDEWRRGPPGDRMAADEPADLRGRSLLPERAAGGGRARRILASRPAVAVGAGAAVARRPGPRRRVGGARRGLVGVRGTCGDRAGARPAGACGRRGGPAGEPCRRGSRRRRRGA